MTISDTTNSYPASSWPFDSCIIDSRIAEACVKSELPISMRSDHAVVPGSQWSGPECYVLLIFDSVLHREFERFAFEASSIKNC